MLSIHQVRLALLCIYMFSINYEVFDPTGTGVFSMAKVTAIFYMLSFIGNPLQFLSIKGYEKIIRPLFIFVIFLTIMNIVNVNFYNSNFIEFTLINNIIIMLFLINHERYYPNSLTKGLVFFAIGAISLAVFYYFKIGIENQGGRISLFGDNANIIANRLVIGISIIFYIVFKNNLNYNKWRYILLLPIPLMALFIADTGSRKGFIALFACLFLFFIFYKTKQLHTKVFIAIVGLIFSFYLYNQLMEVEVLAARINETTEEGKIGGRDLLWEKIIPLIEDNLIIGVGKTGYKFYTLKTFGGIQSPHNVILEILAYTGVLGLFIFLYFFFSVFWCSVKEYFKTSEFLGILLFIPIFGMILAGQILGSKMVYMIFAYCIGMNLHINKRVLR